MDANDLFSAIDRGPIYKETIYGRWPVEPYNTATTFLFLAVVLYWWWKIHGAYRENRLIAVILPIIGVGTIGGFLYHSFRDNMAWLLLDWVPIVIAANVAAVYFWRTRLRTWSWSVLLTYTPILISLIMMIFLDSSPSMLSLTYTVLAISVIVPLALYVKDSRKKGLHYFALAVGSIILALTLRTLDRHDMMDFLPMGSHFLWHTFGALTCYFMIAYVYVTKPALRR